MNGNVNQEYKNIISVLESSRDDIKHIQYESESDTIIVVTDYVGYSTDFPNEICQIVADESDNSWGVSLQSDEETFDGHKIMVFKKNPESIHSIYCMYLLACGINVYIVLDIYDQIEDDYTFEDVANEIMRFEIDDRFSDKKDVLDYMNADLSDNSESKGFL
jgi:hypothetical protein